MNVRLIAATNRDLSEEVRKGRFREDLFYRLNVVSLRMPALRERRGDISLLASYFAAKYGKRGNRTVLGISPRARACLLNYDWPGNVRELENAMERAVVLGSSDLILPAKKPGRGASLRGGAGFQRGRVPPPPASPPSHPGRFPGTHPWGVGLF